MEVLLFMYFRKRIIAAKKQVEDICHTIETDTKEIDCDVEVSNSMMGERDQMLGTLQV